MHPTDFPIEKIGALQATLLAGAERRTQEARACLTHSQPGATGHYEAALALHEAAQMVQATGQDIASHLAHRHQADQEQQKPNDTTATLVDTRQIHPDGSSDPLWGVEVEPHVIGRPNTVATLGLSPNVHGELVVTAALGPPGHAPLTSISGTITPEQWADFKALGDRLLSGAPAMP